LQHFQQVFSFLGFIPNSALLTNSQECFAAKLSSNLQAKKFLHICVLQKTYINANLIRSSSKYFLHVFCKLMQLSSNLQAIFFSMCFVN
jgi:hypothetical protein